MNINQTLYLTKLFTKLAKLYSYNEEGAVKEVGYLRSHFLDLGSVFTNYHQDKKKREKKNLKDVTMVGVLLMYLIF